MSKRKRKSTRRTRPVRDRDPSRPTLPNLDKHLRRAENLIEHKRPQDAIELLEPLLESHPRAADLHYLLGYAYIQVGQPLDALDRYEQAMSLRRDPDQWVSLASLYLEVGLNMHALHAFRQALRRQPEGPASDAVRLTIAAMEGDIQNMADEMGFSPARVEKGLHFHEEAQRALQHGDYSGCIAANRRAMRFLGDWPPLLNNLSLALFTDGRPQDAVATVQRVIASHPDNVQALSNAIHFLAWTGRREEAQALWARLRQVKPEDDGLQLKMAEAAAILEDDEHVYELLKPLDGKKGIRPDIPGLGQRMSFFLAVAEANLGRPEAPRRLKKLAKSRPALTDWLKALKEGRSGPGWAERFPYFHISEMLPQGRLEEFLDLLGGEAKMAPNRFRREVTRFAERFPQIVMLAEKAIWEEKQPDVGIAILEAVDTPAAHAALRRFGLSQAGDDAARMEALFALLRLGAVSPDETLLVWQDGQRRPLQMRQYEISDDVVLPYTDEVVDLLNEGLVALKADNNDRAEQVLQRALNLEPRAKEAYNNLASVYARRKDYDRAKEMYRAALEIDPLYVFPRCNLASFLLNNDDVEGAIEMLKPLADLPRFHPQEMAFYSYTQARIFVKQDEFEKAKDALEMAVEIWPDYEPAKELLSRLNLIVLTRQAFGDWRERQHKRDTVWRARLQEKLSTPDPTLSEALPLYTKEILTGMARKVVRWGSWSALRKAELIERIIQELADPDDLNWLVGRLADEERDALRQVLARGGSMPWAEFDAAHDNDLEESRYWQWHEPETIMGRLRMCGLLVEATVDGELLVAIPAELRPLLAQSLG